MVGSDPKPIEHFIEVYGPLFGLAVTFLFTLITIWIQRKLKKRDEKKAILESINTLSGMYNDAKKTYSELMELWEGYNNKFEEMVKNDSQYNVNYSAYRIEYYTMQFALAMDFYINKIVDRYPTTAPSLLIIKEHIKYLNRDAREMIDLIFKINPVEKNQEKLYKEVNGKLMYLHMFMSKLQSIDESFEVIKKAVK